MKTSQLVAVVLLLVALVAQVPAAAPPAVSLTFEQHVRPILKAHCLECHGEGSKLRGSLDLRLRRLLADGGDSGPAIVPGKAEASLLYQRVRDHQMPPGKVKLSSHDIERIGRWIAAGARTVRPEPEKLAPGLYISEEDRSFWAFQPIRQPQLPTVRDADRARTPIDRFLLARLEEQGLSFNPQAGRHSLIRRLSFDLLGLPPTPEEVEAFVTDTRPDAYERLVDRLLASPAYGERWGRHWLDVAGYADSHGYTGTDPVRRYAWKYRDWVVRAFNADRPYDRFLVDQIAGDELVRPPHARLKGDDLDRLIATGFLRTAPDGTASGGVNVKEASNQVLADTVQIVSTAVLGMTMHCAQCHNHRYDPIPQADYYRMRAIFEPAYDVSRWRSPGSRLVSLVTPAQRAKGLLIEKEALKIDQVRLKKQTEYIERTFQKQLAKVPDALRPTIEKAYRTPAAKRKPAQVKLLREHPSVNVSPGSLYLYDRKAADDLKKYTADAAKLRATKPVEDFVDVLTETPGTVPVTRLFNRGDIEQPREPIAPGGMTILVDHKLAPIPENDPGLPTTGRRLAFARQVTSGKHPLTARVIVNRIWHHHFGRGIVGTPGDFGKLGDRPTHPELLDWLASTFQQDWSIKRLHRLILTSTAYRQSSRQESTGARIDPDNRLLWRMSIRRLEAEALRDAVLAVSGRLNRCMHGAPVPVMPDAVGQIILGVDRRDGAGYLRGDEVVLGENLYRRSLYVQARRSMPLSVLEAFDTPVMAPACDRRSFSTVAPQALLLMNSDFMVRRAGDFARRIEREAGTTPALQVRRAWRLAFGREADPRQLADALAYLHAQADHYRQAKRDKTDPEGRRQALTTLCHALLGSNPFLYVD